MKHPLLLLPTVIGTLVISIGAWLLISAPKVCRYVLLTIPRTRLEFPYLNSRVLPWGGSVAAPLQAFDSVTSNSILTGVS